MTRPCCSTRPFGAAWTSRLWSNLEIDKGSAHPLPRGASSFAREPDRSGVPPPIAIALAFSLSCPLAHQPATAVQPVILSLVWTGDASFFPRAVAALTRPSLKHPRFLSPEPQPTRQTLLVASRRRPTPPPPRAPALHSLLTEPIDILLLLPPLSAIHS